MTQEVEEEAYVGREVKNPSNACAEEAADTLEEAEDPVTEATNAVDHEFNNNIKERLDESEDSNCHL